MKEQKNRSEQLAHQPRGIVKWHPFNSLPEFTAEQKAIKNKVYDPDVNTEYDEDREYYFNDVNELLEREK